MTTHPRTTNAAVVRLLLAYASLVPLAFVPFGTNSVGASDVLFPVALFVLAMATGRVRSTARSILAAFLLVVAITTMLHYLTAQSTSLAVLADASRLVAIFMPFFVAARARSLSRHEVDRVVRAFLVSGTTACFIGIALDLLGIQMRDTQQTDYFGSGIATEVRAGGLLGNSSDFGHLAAILGSVAISFAIIRGWSLIMPAAVFGISAYSAYISTSRAAILHLVVALLFALPALITQRRIALGFLLLPAALVSLILLARDLALTTQQLYVLRRFDFLGLSADSTFYEASSRVSTWATMREFALDHPIIGIGYGATVPATGNAGDNSFLTIAAETGMLAGTLYLGFWSVLAFAFLRLSDRKLRYAGLSLVLSEVAHMLTVDVHRMWSSTPLMLLFAGLLLAEASRDSHVGPSEADEGREHHQSIFKTRGHRISSRA